MAGFSSIGSPLSKQFARAACRSALRVPVTRFVYDGFADMLFALNGRRG
jgi:predicted DCC family thiol-disulfide oxidoreductase YuxK